MYENKRTTIAEGLERTMPVALTGEYWTSVSNPNYRGAPVHYINEKQKRHSHTLIKTEERHHAEACPGHFMDVAKQWDTESKVSTLCTDSARNMVAAARQLPFDHLPCIPHSLTVEYHSGYATQNSTFDNAIAKCR